MRTPILTYLFGKCKSLFAVNLGVLFLVLSGEIRAQQEWGYTQYLFNLYDINSAYAGNHGAGSFGARYRSQWVGMAGAPETQFVSFHTPLLNNNLGAGIKLLNENIGLRNQFTGKVSAAYKLKLDRAVLSIGIGGGVIKQRIDREKLKAYDPNDVQLQNMAETITTPVLDFSLFYNTKRFYAGLESGRINRSQMNLTDQSLSRLYYNLSAVCGYMHPMGNGNILQVSSLMRMSENNLWQAEINALYLVKSRLWFGGGYRWESSAHVMACVNFSEQFRLGLSYDISTSALRSFNDGSAEVFLGFNLKSKSGKSIRYF